MTARFDGNAAVALDHTAENPWRQAAEQPAENPWRSEAEVSPAENPWRETAKMGARAESVVTEVPERKKPATPDAERAAEPKVIIQEKQENLDDAKRQEIMDRISGTSLKKLQDRSNTERQLTNDIVHRMNVDLARGAADENRMQHYRNELADLRDRIEELQEQARNTDPRWKNETNLVLSENHESLRKISTALKATMMETEDAARAIAPITPAVEIQQEAQPSKDLEKEITQKYGADPETLRAGGGPFLKRTLFNFRHWLAGKTNQESEYDTYRAAKNREESRRQKEAPTKQDVPPPPKWLNESAHAVEQPMTIDRAKSLVRHSDTLWEESKNRFDKNVQAVGAMMQMASKYGIRSGQGAATDFILLIGKYIDVRDNLLDKERADALHDDVIKVARALRMKTNSLLQQSLSQGTSRMQRPARSIGRRQNIRAAQRRRWKT